MKNSLISLLLILTSLNSYSEVLDLHYHGNDNDNVRKHTCPYDMMACPRDYNPLNDESLKNMISADELNNIFCEFHLNIKTELINIQKNNNFKQNQ